MQLLQFSLKTIAEPNFLQLHHTIVIQGSEYPTIFANWWIENLKRESLQVITMDCAHVSFQEAQAQLLSYCLGSSFVYVVRSLNDLDGKNKQLWLSFLRHYQGPHTLIVFSQEELEPLKDDKWVNLEISRTIHHEQFGLLCDAFFDEADATRIKSQFAPHLFAQKQEISFDFACMSAWYALLIGNHIEPFFSTWFPQLLVSDQSLFTLSQYFFAQQPRLFFNVWYDLKDVYPLAFWISFWSDQLWRAYSYLFFMKQQQVAMARKAGYKLPFSFLQRDWKKHRVDFIQQLHDQLYLLDCRFKQGLTADLELFYCRMLYKK